MRSLLAGCAVILCIACGSANTSTSSFEDNDSSVSGETGNNGDSSVDPDTGDPKPPKDTGGGGEDTGMPPKMDTAPPALTLDNVCQRLADATCTSALGSCCGTKGLAYKEAGCRAAITASCGEQVKAIKEGKGTFSEAAFPACATALNALALKCSVPILEFLKSYAACDQLLNGYRAPGDSCGDDWECKVSPGAFANCSNSGRCESVSIVGKDAMCVYAGSTRAFCDYGLACYFTSSSAGTCNAAKAIGAPCDASWQCGFGNYCERGFVGMGKCVAGLGVGATCYDNDRCASGGCVSNKCTDPNSTLASPALCSGATG
jgi:hypothetical protein